MSLSTLIKGIQDIMRKDPGVDGDAQRLSQLSWLLFLKVFDAREEEYEIEEDHYRSPIPAELRWRAWATNREGISADPLIEFINGQLFPTLKALPGADRDPRARIVREMTDTEALEIAVIENAQRTFRMGLLDMREIYRQITDDKNFFGLPIPRGVSFFETLHQFALLVRAAQGSVRPHHINIRTCDRPAHRIGVAIHFAGGKKGRAQSLGLAVH